jgi:ABC-type glutathione transport system ATPase component
MNTDNEPIPYTLTSKQPDDPLDWDWDKGLHNPIGHSNLFATPDDAEALDRYVANFSGGEGVAAAMAQAMTINLCSVIVDQLIERVTHHLQSMVNLLDNIHLNEETRVGVTRQSLDSIIREMRSKETP